ncbi:MAG: NAD-dependent dehydratase, partial [Candidatus Limiplasma sp.]|nr:NAD-dependent dehydratase [Candidatus Limiplasma sp.]
MKKALFIGGTGTISNAVSKRCLEKGWELYLLNRGNHPLPEGAKSLCVDVNDEEKVRYLLEDMHFDVVADFIIFTVEQLERDIRLFSGRTDQYLFISSASAYQKPPVNPLITESTPLCNPYWEYSRNKAACEDRLMKEYRE